MEQPRITTLPNGLRVVTRTARGEAEYFGVYINAGSRDEDPEHFGLAHFVEHTIFKGTLKRRSCHIINRMESVGGELNAFTTKEETAVYSIFPRGYLPRAMELIADLITSSRFPDAEIDLEREVVAEEIRSYLDSPDESVADDFEDLIFANSGLGHNILGSEASISQFDSTVCRNYITSSYTPGRMVVFYCGSSGHDRTVRNIERYFGHMHHPDIIPARPTPDMMPQFTRVMSASRNQAHTILGARVPGLMENSRFAIALMCNILGGPGMNSLLNVELRERRGLVYTVEATPCLYSDCGAVEIYYGCDPSSQKRCTQIVTSAIARLAETPLSPTRLERAKRQYLGQVTVSGDNREQSALSMGRGVLIYGEAPSSERLREHINSLTAADICSAASLLLHPSSLTLE